MKRPDYRMLMNSKNHRKTKKRKSLLANVAVSGMLLTGAMVAGTTFLWSPTVVEAAVVHGQLFGSITTSNDQSSPSSRP